MASDHRLSGRARTFLTGIFATNVGNGMYTLAVGNLLYQRTHSVLGYALVLISEFLFKVLLQSVSGVDDFPPVQICVICDVCRCVAVLGAFWLFLGGHAYLAIGLATLAINFFKPFYISASFRLAGQINEPRQFERYSAAFAAVKSSGYLLGVMLFGLVADRLSVSWVILGNAVSYLLMLLVQAVLQRAVRAHGERFVPLRGVRMSGGWGETVELARDRGLLKAALAASVDPALLYVVSLLVLPMSQTWFAGHAGALAWLQGASVFGAAAAAMLIKRTAADRPLHRQRQRWLGFVGTEVLLLVCLGGSRVLAVSVVLVVLLGVTCAASSAHHLARLMRWTGDYPKGRIAGFQMLISSIMMAVLLPVVSVWTTASLGFSFVCPLVLTAGFAALLVRLGRSGAAGDIDAGTVAHEG